MSHPAALRPAAFAFVSDLDVPVLDDADAHHLGRVLRLRPGEVVVASDGRGGWRPCVVGARSPSGPVLEPTGPVAVTVAPAPAITIGFALTKGERPELVVQKLTELGVDRIAPIAADRSVVRWDDDRAVRHHARLVAVAREASMQCRRPHLPEVLPLAGLAASVAAVGAGTAALCEAEAAGRPGMDRAALYVGPEGGWSPEEMRLAVPHVGLGLTTLRAETAAIVAAVLLCAHRSATLSA